MIRERHLGKQDEALEENFTDEEESDDEDEEEGRVVDLFVFTFPDPRYNTLTPPTIQYREKYQRSRRRRC